MYLVD